jgi:iron complex outermembrane receptor protein
MNSLYEDSNGNSSNLIMKYNRQDNSNYNTLSKAQFEEDPRQDYSTTPGLQQQRSTEQILQAEP